MTGNTPFAKFLKDTLAYMNQPIKTPPGVTLRGDRNCCAGCGQIFNSTYAFDKHRTGPTGERRCMTVEEMTAAGMSRIPGGWWVTKLRNNESEFPK